MKALSFVLRFAVIVAVGSAALAASVALLAPAGRALAHSTTPLGKLEVTLNAPPARSIIYDHLGNVMGSFSSEDRAPVKLKDIPKVLVDAVLSIEDRKFYEHHGVDWGGTVRALFKNVDAGGISQGGSTITQQLVKNTLSTNRKRDLKTKAREAILAIRLENELTKDQILEKYLNLVYFGNGAYGVQAASERYFLSPDNPNPLHHLTLPQAALLAGLIQSPEGLNPIRHPDSAARRRNEVLDAMVTNGKTTVGAAKAAKASPLPTKLSYPLSTQLDYFKDELRNRLLSDDPNVSGDPGELLGSNQQQRANALDRGGLKIYTSYDPYLQYAANKAIQDQFPQGTPFTASLVLIDNADGGVRAIANALPYGDVKFDPATNGPGRPPGSSFKTFTLAAALSHGYSPEDSVLTDPVVAPWAGYTNAKPLSGDCTGGRINLRTAIAKSDNCAFVRTEMSLGPGNRGLDGVSTVIDTAHAMGIDAPLDRGVLSTTLGTQLVHPLEMAQAYSVLPNDGVLKRANFITKIVGPDRKTVYQANDAPRRVLDPQVARTEIDMLKGVLKFGTASGTLSGFGRPAAGKTGTTSNNYDGWFIGFTPQYTAAVWMGDLKASTPLVVHGRSVYGADYPAKIWQDLMRSATSNLPPLDFAPPDPSQWPNPSYIDEFGRKFTFDGPPVSDQPTVPSTAVTPSTVQSTPTTRKTPPTTTHSPPTTHFQKQNR